MSIGMSLFGALCEREAFLSSDEPRYIVTYKYIARKERIKKSWVSVEWKSYDVWNIHFGEYLLLMERNEVSSSKDYIDMDIVFPLPRPEEVNLWVLYE